MKKLALLAVLVMQGWGLPLQAVEPKVTQDSAEVKDISSGKPPVSSTDVADKKVAVARSTAAPQVDINQASAEQISQGLVGVGKKKAQAIVDYREQYGAFSQLDQLKEVKGIGPSLLERNRGRVKL